MKKDTEFKDYNSLEVEEKKILEAEISEIKKETQQYKAQIALMQKEDLVKRLFYQNMYKRLSLYCGYQVDETNFHEINIPEEDFHEIFDEVAGDKNNLIRHIHFILPYSLLNNRPELKEYVPVQNPQSSLDLLNDKSTSRAFEIISEDISENTHKAHLGDIIFFQAFLSAIGFSFEKPITEKEIITFVTQLAEGVDHEIDKKLVAQGYKSKLGTHAMATIKRRIGSLSVYLELKNLPNPCRSKKVVTLLNKLIKKYGSSKPAGKAITKDILYDMLDTCGNKPIDIRDKAVILFAWGSGGRRRSEVSSAQIKDLTKHSDGDYTYLMPKSKTDQEGQGFHLPLKGTVAKALTEWLEISKISDGAVFRSLTKGGEVKGALSPVDINRIVKRRLKKAGYDEKQYGAHGLRSGFVTTCGKRSIPLGDVMQMTTHRTVATVMRYYQAGNIVNNKAANLAD